MKITVAKSRIITAIAAAAILTSCGDNTDRKARQFYDSAAALLEKNDAAAAVAMLDSLDTACPGATDLRRRGMHLRAKATERLTVAALAETDSLMACLAAEIHSMQPLLKKVDNPVEPYFIAEGSSLAPTGLQARLAPDGTVYLVSSLTGHPVGHVRVSASTGGGTSASTADVAFDGERSRRDGNVETVHFVGAECDSLVRFVAAATMPVTVTWEGKSAFSRPLTAAERNGIAVIGNYAAAATALKLADLRHSRLEKQLEICRSQIARTFPDEQPAGSASSED